jgi:hypothetical protein
VQRETGEKRMDAQHMTDREAVDMMNRCKHEIINLKAVIAQLQPKADAYDNLAAIVRLLPQPSRGYGEDLVWVLEKRIRELTSKPAEAATEQVEA